MGNKEDKIKLTLKKKCSCQKSVTLNVEYCTVFLYVAHGNCWYGSCDMKERDTGYHWHTVLD